MLDANLESLLTLTQVDSNVFEGKSWDLGFRALFGGQVLGQALAAASATVDIQRIAHSFHSYFVLPGDPSHSVIFQVENIRDGRSFSTRRVKAVQKNKTIFCMTASFQLPEVGLTHQQSSLPAVLAPDAVTPDIDFYEKIIDDLPSKMQQALKYHKVIDIRTIQEGDPIQPNTTDAHKYIWMRIKTPLAQNQVGQSLSPLGINQQMLAYASDYHFLATSLQPHNVSVRDKDLKIASIDHSMWFHQPIDFTQWVLYCTESPTSGGGRGLVKGQFFDQSGKLLASTMQEGLIRKGNT